MKTKRIFFVAIMLFLVTIACKQEGSEISAKENEQQFLSALEKHLDAVERKNLKTLKSTLPPHGKMELIQPSTEVIKGVDGFIKFHEAFFKHPNWSIKFTVTSKNVGDKIGVATTETLYKEPERNGKPYSSRMTVTYTLEKINGKWYVIKDHASFISKSTD